MVRADQMTVEVKRFGFSGPDYLVTKHYNAWKTDFQQAIGQALNILVMESMCPEES